MEQKTYGDKNKHKEEGGRRVKKETGRGQSKEDCGVADEV